MATMRKATSKMSVFTQVTQILGPNSAVAPMIVPPDGGWGWVIVVVGLVSSILTDGLQICFFLFRDPMTHDLNIDSSDVAFLSALNTSFYFIGGVLACSVGNHFGFRTVMVLGAFGASSTYASGYILNNMIHFYIIIGVIGGISSGFIAVAAVLPPGFYFDKKRSIAMGLVSCGSGFGGLTMPQLVKIVLTRYGWRDAFLFEAGLMSTLIFFGLLIRPIKPVMVVVGGGTDENLARGESAYPDFRVTYDQVSLSMPPSIIMRPEASSPAQPTINQMMDEIDVINIRMGDGETNVRKRLEELAQPRGSVENLATVATVAEITIIMEPPFKARPPWYKCGCFRSIHFSLPSRPLLRTDLYYHGNIRRLPEYTDKPRDLDYHLQVTKVPTYYETIQDLTSTYTTWCCHSVVKGLKLFIDFSLMKSPSFICLCLCGFFTYVAFFLPYLYTSPHLKSIGKGDYDSTLVSSIGLGTMIGRLTSGIIITAIPLFSARFTIVLTSFIGAVAITSILAWENLFFKGMCLFVFGYAVGYFTPLRSIIIVDFFGLEKLTSGTGMLIVCLGTASLVGPPIAEYAWHVTDDSNAPFYVCGVFLFLACIILWPMKIFSKWEKKREEIRLRRRHI